MAALPRTRAPAATAATAAHAGGLVDLRLANGARILVLPTAGGPGRGGAAAVQLWVGAGTSAERPDEHGCAHLLEHMLFKPLAPQHVPKVMLRSAGVPASALAGAVDLASALEAMGGDSNAFTSHDETVVHTTVPASAVAPAVALIAAAALRPALAAATLAQEREVVVEEIAQYDDEPGQRVFQALLRRLHGRHSYARPVLGLAREVRSHSAARLRGYHRRNYAGDRITLVVVGAVEVPRVVAAARRALGWLPAARPLLAEAPPATQQVGPRVHLRRADVQEAHLMLGWPAPPVGDPEAPAIDIASVVLGHGEASRLVRETRRRDQLVSEVSCSCESMRRRGSFIVHAHTTAPQAEAAVAALFAQVARLCAQPIDAEELARARAILESDPIYRQETVQGRAHALGYYASVFGDLGRERAYYAALAQLTPEAVRAACARVLAPHLASVSAELPEQQTSLAALRRLERTIARQVPARAPTRARAPKLRADRFGVVALELGGLRVRAIVDAGVPMAAGWLVWPGGQVREPVALAGAAATTAALLTRGDARHTGDEISRSVDGRAASLDGFAGRNSVGLRWESLARDAAELLDLALECARTPSFPGAELAEERRVALQELAAEADDPAQLAIRAMSALFYGEHPFSRPVRGTASGLRAQTGPRLRALWTRDYPLHDAVLALVGDIDLAALLDQVRLALGPGRKGHVRKASPKVAPPRLPTGPRERTIYKDREQAHIALGFPGLRIGAAQAPALDLLSTVLGGQSGRLFTALREREGLVYEVSVSSLEGRDVGHVLVHASTSQDKLARAQAAIAAELAAVADKPISAEELRRARAYLIGQHESGQQRRGRIASMLALTAAHDLDHARHFLYPQRLAAVTTAQVWALARQIFDPRGQVTATVRAR